MKYTARSDNRNHAGQAGYKNACLPRDFDGNVALRRESRAQARIARRPEVGQLRSDLSRSAKTSFPRSAGPVRRWASSGYLLLFSLNIESVINFTPENGVTLECTSEALGNRVQVPPDSPTLPDSLVQ